MLSADGATVKRNTDKGTEQLAESCFSKNILSNETN